MPDGLSETETDLFYEKLLGDRQNPQLNVIEKRRTYCSHYKTCYNSV